MAKLGNTNLFWEDALVIALYFVMVLLVGIWSSVRSRRDTVGGYFLAGRTMHWVPVGASLFASNIGSEHFIGLAGSGANSGIGIAGFELGASYILLMLGWLFVPVYIAAGVFTMPEYLRKRFGGQRIRIYLSVLTLLLYVFTKISADLYAGALFINQSIKLDMYGSIVSLLAIASIFTIVGGLNAVIWTDFIQTILMLVGAFTLTVLSFIRVGGYKELIEKFKSVELNESFIGYDSENRSCSAIADNYMDLLRSPSDPELPGTGITFGLLINAVWYWCSDQVIVQRTLSAKDYSHAKGGCILAGYLKLLPLFLIVFPGMASRVLFPDEVGCSNPDVCEAICGSRLGCTNIAYPKLVLEVMPTGARGLMISVMLAALMSSLTSIFNSSSTIFTLDLWTRIRKQATETELLIVGRLFVVILVAISIAWIPIIEAVHNSQLFHYVQSVTSYLAPPVCAIFVMGIFTWRINEQGAFWGLMAGFCTGMIRFVWEFSYTVPACSSNLKDPRPAIISQVHYLHFSILLFLITCTVATIISLSTEPIGKEYLCRLTFWSRHSREIRINISSKSKKNNILSEGKGNINVAFQSNGEYNAEPMNCPAHLYDVSLQATEKNPENPTVTVIIDPAILKENLEMGCSEKESVLVENKPLWRRALYFLCGMSDVRKHNRGQLDQPTPETAANEAADLLQEKPFWKTFCDTNAIILLLASSFIWGFYA